MHNNISPITKTIMESLEEVKKRFPQLFSSNDGREGYDLEVSSEILSHLLQSQIRLIESWIQELKWDISFLHDCYENSECCPHCIRDNFIDSKISSLNETLEELKKSLCECRHDGSTYSDIYCNACGNNNCDLCIKLNKT